MTRQSPLHSPAPLRPAEAFALTEAVIKSHSRTFYFATALLPRRERQAIRALYAFCRATDDLVDSQCATLNDLERWRAQVALEPEDQPHPLLYAWGMVRRIHGVDRRYEQALIDGVAMDLTYCQYSTWDDLRLYCYRVASTVGLLAIPIIGLAPGATFEQAAPFAIELGIALQLTNILRDVGEDAHRGRVYLPQEDLEKFGLQREDILNGVMDSRFIGLMQFEIARARVLYRRALPGIRLLHPRARPAVGAAALLYAAILHEIERIGYQVHTRRAHTSTWRKLRLLPTILLQVQRLPPLENVLASELPPPDLPRDSLMEEWGKPETA